MKEINLGTSVKWQRSDTRNVLDVRKKVVNDISFPNGPILEIGCATGNFFELLNISNNTFSYYTGIDIDKNQIRVANRKFPKADFRYGDILNNKFKPLIRSAKIIVSFQVLEHIKEDLNLLSKMSSGTRFVFSVPNFAYRSKSPGGHIRWFELDGWVDRYKSMLDIAEAWTIKHYKKNRKIFVLQGTKR